ncbi:hypothetical protein [Streptomyces sp. NPDC127114]|uniref:hypothetical protein n=1 Tax=Streptomyces sp. NPDC127114 TaxID=3345366 RepID=UPI003632D66F
MTGQGLDDLWRGWSAWLPSPRPGAWCTGSRGRAGSRSRAGAGRPGPASAQCRLTSAWTDQQPKRLTTEAVQASDYVITMGCGDACPYFPGRTYLDWQLEDPAGRGVEAVRPIRDEIKELIEGLIAEIDARREA